MPKAACRRGVCSLESRYFSKTCTKVAARVLGLSGTRLAHCGAKRSSSWMVTLAAPPSLWAKVSRYSATRTRVEAPKAGEIDTSESRLSCATRASITFRTDCAARRFRPLSPPPSSSSREISGFFIAL